MSNKAVTEFWVVEEKLRGDRSSTNAWQRSEIDGLKDREFTNEPHATNAMRKYGTDTSRRFRLTRFVSTRAFPTNS